MLKYKKIENLEELSSLFKRKKENMRIRTTHDKRATMLLVIMCDDKTMDFQGAAVIGIENDMWGICALRVAKAYRKFFLSILEDNVPQYIFDNELE